MEIPKPKEGLREMIESLRRDWDRTREKKRHDKALISHRFAHALGHDLRKEGLSIRWPKGDNANYFCAELDTFQILISPFASQEEWWEKPSGGFMDYVREVTSRAPSCRWGIILFRVPVRAPDPDVGGFWIEGADFERALEWPEKFNAANVRVAVKKKVAREFSDKVALIRLIRNGIESGPRLIRSRRVTI